ncbi:HDOD domain-containing protein [Thalassomonas actiniarum]|uniref:HDOD domain-containing protein n=1 Tax=Thalassomonas actiniarum TaxID=485447 RepID=A0AAE9YQB5_9GAMM|nr:HDOD domain-containing protein [Thalassomonas actiniarum]WDD97601.1 HDOD domain-containing protein [Thalassomonas actiniarum]
MKAMFVDDEPLVLKGIQRSLYNCGYEIVFAEDALEALFLLTQEKIDLIVTDMRMPKMDGADLLEKITQFYPDMVRIILSGHADEEASLKASLVAHQWLTKPSKPEMLLNLIENIKQVRTALPEPAIRKLLGSIKTLPSPPRTYIRLNSILQHDATNMERFAEVIAEDSSLVAKILQLSNSSFFINSREVCDITEAITRLGVDIIVSIVAATELHAQIYEPPGFSVLAEQSRGLAVGRLAHFIAAPEFKQEAMLAGLLHNIGKLILPEISASSLDTYLALKKDNRDNIELERELFGIEHSQLSGYLLHIWNFPYHLIETLLSFRHPNALSKKAFTASAAVYVAYCLINQYPIDREFIKHFDIAEKVKYWRNKADNYR